MTQSPSEALVRCPLGKDVEPFVLDRLRGMPLADSLRALPLPEGRFWTWAPQATEVTLGDVKTGLPSGVTQESAQDAFLKFAVDYLTPPHRLVVFEDFVSRVGDPALASEAPKSHAALGEYIYWYATESDREQLEALMSWSAPRSCIVLTRPSTDWAARAPSHVTIANLHDVAVNSDHFAVDAFDFDGLVVWSRRSSEMGR
jgi:hypothetical protein